MNEEEFNALSDEEKRALLSRISKRKGDNVSDSLTEQ
jgi:hypothetical protein